jgi:hypothetical protein
MKLYFSKEFISYINLFESRRAFCEKFQIDESTLSNILAERRSVPSELVAKIKEESGMDFEKAFEVKE